MKTPPNWPIFLSSLLILAACDLEKEVEIDLPVYESRLVVESYLIPGEPFKLLLSKSAPFFEPFPTMDNQYLENILENKAEVFVRFGSQEVELGNTIYFDPVERKLYNYFSEEAVPDDYSGEFQLEIKTKFIFLPGHFL